MRRGEVYDARLDPSEGSEQGCYSWAAELKTHYKNLLSSET